MIIEIPWNHDFLILWTTSGEVFAGPALILTHEFRSTVKTDPKNWRTKGGGIDVSLLAGSPTWSAPTRISTSQNWLKGTSTVNHDPRNSPWKAPAAGRGCSWSFHGISWSFQGISWSFEGISWSFEGISWSFEGGQIVHVHCKKEVHLSIAQQEEGAPGPSKPRPGHWYRSSIA